MTPLANYERSPSELGHFQLLYRDYEGTCRYYNGEADSAGVRRYPYAYGKAIAFASHFLHSTEPGRSASAAEPNVYCAPRRRIR